MVKPYDNNIGNEGEWLAFPKQYPDFKPMPNFLPERNRWYCYELMVRANTPGQSNGEVKCWIDGNLISDFPNLNMRSIDTLKIDEAHIGLHAKQSERGTKMVRQCCYRHAICWTNGERDTDSGADSTSIGKTSKHFQPSTDAKRERCGYCPVRDPWSRTEKLLIRFGTDANAVRYYRRNAESNVEVI